MKEDDSCSSACSDRSGSTVAPVRVPRLRSLRARLERVLDAERGRMYFDLVFDSLSEAAQKELRAMDPAKYQYRSEFAKRYFGQGLSEGLAKGELHGRAALLQRLLARRFGALPAEATELLSTATIDELDAIGERLLSAATLEEALGSPPSRP